MKKLSECGSCQKRLALILGGFAVIGMYYVGRETYAFISKKVKK